MVVFLDVLVVHAEADLAQVEILFGKLKSLKELFFVWIALFILILLLVAQSNAKLIIKLLDSASLLLLTLSLLDRPPPLLILFLDLVWVRDGHR